ncbi:alpha/beta hydrolase [Micrococcaceae bacterium Sec5.1]
MSQPESSADSLMSKRQTHTLNIGGAEVKCHLYGTAHEGQNAIVLLPGIGGNASMHFSFLLPMLARKRQVMAIDFSNPRTLENEPLQLDYLIDQASKAIDALLPDRSICLIGFSLGAEVAVGLATVHPAPKQLVLIAGWLKSSTSQQLFATIWKQLAAAGSQSRARFARLASFSTTHINGYTISEIDQSTPIKPGRFTDVQVELASRIDLTISAPRIRAQTLVIGCSSDGMVDTEQVKALFGAIPHARYTEIDSGNAVVLERPAELLSLITAFMSDPEQYASGSILPTATP